MLLVVLPLPQVLMSPGDQCFRGYGRRNGERRRKSVRGCIVSQVRGNRRPAVSIGASVNR